MNISVVVRARSNSPLIVISIDGHLIEIEDPHPEMEFEVYLDGALVGSGVGRDQLDNALLGLRSILNAARLKELASYLVQFSVEDKPVELLATFEDAGLMFCDRQNYDSLGPNAFGYAEDFMLERYPDAQP